MPSAAPQPLTPGRILFEDIVPEEFRHDIPPGTPVGAREVSNILQRVAEGKPHLYNKISSELLKLGAKGSVETSTSFSLDDLKPRYDKAGQIAGVEAQEAAIRANPKLNSKQKEDQLIKLYHQMSNVTPDLVYDSSLKHGSNLARMVAAGARGNKQQLSSSVGSDWLVIDSAGNPVPVPLKRSYGEGLSPAEFFASSYGTRQGLVSTKLAVQRSGFVAKQLASAAQDLSISVHDCGTKLGLPVAANDGDNVGALLAKPAAGYNAGTIITPQVQKDLNKLGDKKIVVRSPMTCQAPHGLCALCSGVRERGHLPGARDNIGLAAASAVSEPLSQALMSAKHCLLSSTLVRMADWSTKEIQYIRQGDFVLGADRYGRTFPVEVLNVFNNGIRLCNRYEFSLGGNERIEVICTEDHKILSRWYKTECAGQALNHINQVLPIGHSTSRFSAVLPAELDDTGLLKNDWALFLRLVPMGHLPTFDIEVDHPDHLFVLASGLIVSNSGGVANASKASRTGAFESINSLFQSPKIFPNATPLAQTDGRITKVEDAPQGGRYVHIGEHQHYVHPEQELLVKSGDTVEAGDPLSTGVAPPAEFIRLRGVGEGRKYLLGQLQSTLKENEMNADRRNLEVLSRAVVNHVRATGPEGIAGLLPDDISRYSDIQHQYHPPDNAVFSKPKDAHGMYLHRPVLHYTIGTRVTPRVAKEMEDVGEDKIVVSPDKPDFDSHMVRLMENPGYGTDWMTQLGSSYVKGNLLDTLHRGGGTAPLHGSAPLPGLAEAVEFGRPGKGKSSY